MPRKSEWLRRIPEALEELRQTPTPVVDRAILERVLRIHRRVAIRLMHCFGGFQSGKTFLIDRLQLIERLERVNRGEEVLVERSRRTRLTDELEKTRLVTRGRKVSIRTVAEARDRALKDLPAGIHLQPGELKIKFSSAEELLRHLFELSQAIVNDYERFRVAVEDAPAV